MYLIYLLSRGKGSNQHKRGVEQQSKYVNRNLYFPLLSVENQLPFLV